MILSDVLVLSIIEYSRWKVFQGYEISDSDVIQNRFIELSHVTGLHQSLRIPLQKHHILLYKLQL